MVQARFADQVLAVVRRIPRGRVATYGDVAALARRPGAARAVGSVMRGVRASSTTMPCHRVVAAGGVGGYGGHGVREKVRLLRAEGISVDSRGRVVGFHRVRWAGTPGG